MYHRNCKAEYLEPDAIKIAGTAGTNSALINVGADHLHFQIAGQLVNSLVSLQREVAIGELKATSRGKADICLARQIAMYLLHTVFSCPYHQVARIFCRDRTTISHACQLVEDLRDDAAFDLEMEQMENLLAMSRQLSEARQREAANALDG